METVAVVTMNNGENRHNPAFVEGMSRALKEILDDDAVSAVIISSGDEKFWSVGIDVEWMTAAFASGEQGAVRSFLYALNGLFITMLSYPLPLIASINGHVAANGLVLACACDFRFMRADRGLCRFPEVDIGIPFLPGMIEITAKGMPRHAFEELKYTGKTVTARELERDRVILRACTDGEELYRDSMAFASSLRKKRDIFGEMKRRMNRKIIQAIETEDPAYIEPLNLLPGGMPYPK